MTVGRESLLVSGSCLVPHLMADGGAGIDGDSVLYSTSWLMAARKSLFYVCRVWYFIANGRQSLMVSVSCSVPDG